MSLKNKKILVLGGTRFFGREVVIQLLSTGHQVTVSSRNPQNCPKGALMVAGERAECLKTLRGHRFDLTVDLTSDAQTGPEKVFGLLDPGDYVLISSTWVNRLALGVEADQSVREVGSAKPDNMLDLTYRYLQHKLRAEEAVERLRLSGKPATTLRSPIIWGQGDHTRRLQFYRHRMADQSSLILVDGGSNRAQIVWSKDAARVISMWITTSEVSSRLIWELLPDSGVTVKSIIDEIADVAKLEPHYVSLSKRQLSNGLPEYLASEPLWRETSLRPTGSNLFLNMGINPSKISDWSRHVCGEAPTPDEVLLRQRELQYLGGLKAA